MIQCKCCMHQVKDGSAICDICQFPLLASSGVDMNEVGAQFRRQLLEGCSIAVKYHYYEPDHNGRLIEKKGEYVTVADALSLKYHQVKWLKETFNPPEIDRDITLDVRIRHGGRYNDVTLRAHLTKAMTCARLGVYLDVGLMVRFAVGNDRDYVFSGAASLI